MKHRRLARFAPFAPFLGAGLMIVACQTPAEKQRKAEETQGAANQQKTEAQQEADKDIDSFNTSMKAASRRIKVAKAAPPSAPRTNAPRTIVPAPAPLTTPPVAPKP